MDPEEFFTGLALIVGIAVACQLVAPLLRVPALLLLLPAGFAAGNLSDAVDPEAMFGDAFSPLVNVAVALILFHGGMELASQPPEGSDHRIVRHLITIGAALTWWCGALAGLWLLGLPGNLALLLGAILIVSGPTVVGPLLEHARPARRVRRILMWEGTLIDPIGATVAVIVFQAIRATDDTRVLSGAERFLTTMGVGAAAGAIGLVLIWVGLRLAGGNPLLGTQVLLGSVVVAAAGADAVADDAGLVAAVVMGLVNPFLARDHLAEHEQSVMPFFDTVVGISIGVLFVSISALVTPASLQGLLLPCAAVVAVLVLVVRPIVALLAGYGSTLTRGERLFLGWMAPRGIVAAATAASFSAALYDSAVVGADRLLPATFLIIAGTVAVYSLTARPVAALLGVREPQAAGPGRDGPRQGPTQPPAAPATDPA